jgi:hypothetical protein
MTVNKSVCPNCGNLVPNDEHFNEKCFLCVDPEEVTINE